MDTNTPPQFRGDPFFRMDGGHHGPGGLGWVIFALQLLMLAALAVLLVRAFAARGPRDMIVKRRFGHPPAEEILRHRYARGEISRDEYLQASQDLGLRAQEDAPTAEL